MRQIYNFLLYLILPFLPLRLLWKSRRSSAYRQRMAERFGCFDRTPLNSSIWIHAVSVGESAAAIPLVKELKKRYRKETIVVTTMTPTGAERVQKALANEAIHYYVPYDYPGVVKRFLKHIKPKIIVIMETELWPNILYYASQQKIPMLLANARLSKHSFDNYQKIARFAKSMLNCFTTIAAQSKIDAERYCQLGASSEKVVLFGNLKFDIMVPENILQQAQQLRQNWGEKRSIWIAASTHQGEDEKVLTAAKIVLQTIPDALLILVPRHPERFSQVFELCQKNGFKTIRYSESQSGAADTQIILGDVMGQLLLFYAAVDVTFVGGSLIPWGGHNLLEPAALAKPVLAGPNLSAFREISELLLAANAMIKVENETELANQIVKLFSNSSLRDQYGQAAQSVVKQHRGTTENIMKWIDRSILTRETAK